MKRTRLLRRVLMFVNEVIISRDFLVNYVGEAISVLL